MGNKKIKVAILGGAFDPITNAHTQLAEFVLNNSEFDQVWLMPSYKRPEKQMTKSDHRINMIRNVIKDLPTNIALSTYEIDHKLEGGSINVFNRLIQDENFNDYKFSMIIGIDQANNIEQWVDYDELKKRVPFVVVSRKGYRKKPSIDWFTKDHHVYINKHNNISDISSTEVRFAARYLYNKALPNNEIYLKFLENINPAVLNYIKTHKLYE